MCNVNIDECASSPCHNGGTCEDGVNSFSCRCPEGYHDPTCLSEVNECDSNPCIHGACRDSLNGYGARAGARGACWSPPRSPPAATVLGRVDAVAPPQRAVRVSGP